MSGVFGSEYAGTYDVLYKDKDYLDQFKLPLDPADVARSIVFALDQPPHVQIAEMMILPVNRY